MGVPFLVFDAYLTHTRMLVFFVCILCVFMEGVVLGYLYLCDCGVFQFELAIAHTIEINKLSRVKHFLDFLTYVTISKFIL